MLSRLAVRLSEITEHVVPSAFAIALVLTFFTFGLAMTMAGASPSRVVIEWGNGFWTLVPFAMQMALVVLSGYLVSTAPVVDRLFARLATRARSPRGAVILMALVSMGLAWVHWGLSLVGCAMFVRHVVRAEPRVDYRLLVCAAYFGMGATWHAGLSASAPLLVATPGHFLEATIGIIPVTATIFSPIQSRAHRGRRHVARRAGGHPAPAARPGPSDRSALARPARALRASAAARATDVRQPHRSLAPADVARRRVRRRLAGVVLRHQGLRAHAGRPELHVPDAGDPAASVRRVGAGRGRARGRPAVRYRAPVSVLRRDVRRHPGNRPGADLRRGHRPVWPRPRRCRCGSTGTRGW